MSGRETDPQLAPILGVDAEDHIIRALYATDKITDPIFYAFKKMSDEERRGPVGVLLACIWKRVSDGYDLIDDARGLVTGTHNSIGSEEAEAAVAELIEVVDLPDPAFSAPRKRPNLRLVKKDDES
jgi:hypothetical protein